MRRDNKSGEIDESRLDPSPFVQLERWLLDAREAKVDEPGAMCLSTVSADGRPHGRMVLLRGFDERGLVFFTNYRSIKGLDLASNPRASVCFWWGVLERQVRVEGTVSRTTSAESEQYFHSRPRESQIASVASPQSSLIESREALVALVSSLANAQDEIQRPDHWGGFRLQPESFEFWHGRPARLHDRLVYHREGNGWKILRLAP